MKLFVSTVLLLSSVLLWAAPIHAEGITTSIADLTPTPTPSASAPTPTPTPTSTPVVTSTPTATPASTDLPDTGIDPTYVTLIASSVLVIISLSQLKKSRLNR